MRSAHAAFITILAKQRGATAAFSLPRGRQQEET
jgi:hypothetical protein